MTTRSTVRPNRQNSRARFGRSPLNRALGGVCGGIGAMLGVSAWCPRVVFAALTIAMPAFGALLYLLLWVIIPAQSLNDLPTVIGAARGVRAEGTLIIGLLAILVGVVALSAFAGVFRLPNGSLLEPGMLLLIALALLIRQLRRG
jgi:phage shock protein PspC (stress-responsive transcriptional regulator)